MTYQPTVYEQALWGWVSAALPGVDVRFAQQAFPVGARPCATLQVLQVQEEMTPRVEVRAADEKLVIESAYTGTVSVQVYGPNHRTHAEALVRALWYPGETKGVEVRRAVGAVQDLTAQIGTDFLRRSGVDFEFSFRAKWVDAEAYGTITSAELNKSIVIEEPTP